jgi:hypothetical protein
MASKPAAAELFAAAKSLLSSAELRNRTIARLPDSRIGTPIVKHGVDLGRPGSEGNDMRSRFEIVTDDQGRTVFHFLGADGAALLRGLPSRDRYAVKVELMEARTALRLRNRFVRHADDDGHWFAVLTKKDGEPLARTATVETEAMLDQLIEQLNSNAVGAPLLKHLDA